MAAEEEWRQSYEGKVQDLARETQRTMRLAYELRHVRRHFQDVIDDHPRLFPPEQWITWINATLDVCGLDLEGPNYVTAPPGDLLPGRKGPGWRTVPAEKKV